MHSASGLDFDEEAPIQDSRGYPASLRSDPGRSSRRPPWATSAGSRQAAVASAPEPMPACRRSWVALCCPYFEKQPNIDGSFFFFLILRFVFQLFGSTACTPAPRRRASSSSRMALFFFTTAVKGSSYFSPVATTQAHSQANARGNLCYEYIPALQLVGL